jgi:glutamate 5-kinase
MFNNKGDKKVKTIVLKVGTSSIVDENGELNTIRMTQLAWDIIDLRSKGYQVVLVSSGAVACGRKYVNCAKSPLPQDQVLAALGQPEMFQTWKNIFQLTANTTCAQLLYTSIDLNPENQIAYEATKNCLISIMEQGIIPIINENDAVSLEELEMMSTFGDNANLAALVAVMLEADLLSIATNTNGILDKFGKTVTRIVNPQGFVMTPLNGQEKSNSGKGGAKANLKAAIFAKQHNIETAIFNSANIGALPKIVKAILSRALPKKMNFTYIPKR